MPIPIKGVFSGGVPVALGEFGAGEVVPLLYGGTGLAAANANAALNGLLPVQANKAGQILLTNGTDTDFARENIHNLFYNGGCRVASRPTAALTTTPTIGPVDGVYVWASGGSVSAGSSVQTTDISVSAVAAAFVTLTGSGAISFRKRVESVDAGQAKGKTVTAQALVYHNVGSAINYTITLRKANAADDFSAVTDIGTSSNISVPSDTLTVISYTVAAGTCGNGLEAEFKAACGAVTTKIFYASEFKLAVAPGPSPFELIPIEADIARCQRYLPAFFSSSTNAQVGVAATPTTTTALLQVTFFVPARIPPTGIVVSNGTHFSFADGVNAPLVASAIAYGTASAIGGVPVLTVAGATAFRPGRVYFNNASGYLLFTGAEL